jgi:multiple sugar transport system ATP-binding protein
MASIVLEDLRKEFGNFHAVKGVNLEIPDGTFAALLGPSGCGKTTTLRMIAGLESPTSGKIYFDDQCVNDIPPGKRGLGFVFQNYAIFTHMTVYENIAFGLKIKGRPAAEIDQEVNQVARLLQMIPMLPMRAGRLSVNDMQRVALARTMIINPRIFLLDEPFSNLDATFRAYMRGELKRIQHEIKQTMIYVTHDQIEAMSMADNIAVMDFGVLMQFGSPEEIYNRPEHLFVASFIGSPNMNFVDCRYASDNGTGYLVQRAGMERVEVDSHRRQLLERHPGAAKVVLGIRPEHLRVSPQGGEGAQWEGVVYVVEPLGSRTIVHVKVGETIMRVIAPASYLPKPGEPQWVHLDTAYMHIFDADSGRVIR